MPNIEILNNKTHKDLKVITKPSAELGDNIESVLTFPTEFGDIQREYPIVFRKDPENGEFCSMALLGLEPGENLFLQGEQWLASYTPAAIARGPFLIGYQNQKNKEGSTDVPVVNIDMDNPRVNLKEGEAAFHSNGQATPYVEQINRCLLAIHQGLGFSKAMFNAFLKYELIEPVTLDIELNSGEKIRLQGNYTIHEEKLAALSGEALETLNKSGYLRAAFLVAVSLTNINRLIELKNKRS